MSPTQPTEAAVLEALKAVRDPDLNRDIVSLKFIKNLRIDGGRVAFTIELTTPACPVKDQMRDQARRPGQPHSRRHRVSTIEMTRAGARRRSAPEAGKAAVPGVKNIIAVGAGKGGVGKTTVAVNLAIALSQCGGRVAMIDGDIYGPNVPIMLGLKTQLTTDGEKIVPAEQYGIKLVSMAFLTGRRRAGDLARPDAARRHPAVLPRGALGGYRLPDRRHAARAPATSRSV